MKGTDVLSMSWANLDRRKGRTALTCAGVVVGVAALVMMLSLGLGLERAIVGTLKSEFTLRTLSVKKSPGGESKKKKRRLKGFGFGQTTPITDEDLKEIEEIPGVAIAQPYLFLFLNVTVEGPEERTETFPRFEIGGIRPEEHETYAEYLVAGDMITPGERTCIVPASFLTDIFDDAPPADFVGRTLTLSKGAGKKEEPPEELVYTISGIVDTGRLSQLYGYRIFLPMEQAREVRGLTKGGMLPFFYKEGSYMAAEVRVESVDAAATAAKALKKAGFEATTIGDILDVLNILFLVIEGFLACIGAIGLIVSLFGIANTMAMAVLERTREIGIMKALGARNRDIGLVFLCEAGALGALGGIVGLAVAVGIGFLLNVAARGMFELGPDIGLFHVPIWLALGSVGFSMFVSMLAGSLPARRAAKMEPVAALRYE